MQVSIVFKSGEIKTPGALLVSTIPSNNLLFCFIFMHCMHHVIKTHACSEPAFIL